MKIGILSKNNEFNKYKNLLVNIHIDVVQIKVQEDFSNISGIIISGDNFSTIRQLITPSISKKILALAKNDFPIFGTGLGGFLLAKQNNIGTDSLELMDVDVIFQNSAEFTENIDIPILGYPPYKAFFKGSIYIKSIAPNVGILAQLPNGRIIFVRQGNFLAATFNPEVSADIRIYEFFSKIAKKCI